MYDMRVLYPTPLLQSTTINEQAHLNASMILASIKPFWSFPLYVDIGPYHILIHRITDCLSYFLGFQLYRFLKRSAPGPKLNWEESAWLLLGCVTGAVIGAKILAWAEAPAFYWSIRNDPMFWYGGKTIVGGLLGGWIGTECAKRVMGMTHSTGDVCVYPLIFGMCIGRVGCFLTGLIDDTCGSPTTLPWGVDFGDGIPRHPNQIYEILFLLLLALVLWRTKPLMQRPGLFFRAFLASYLGYRFLIEFIKPHPFMFAGMGGIQISCLIALVCCVLSFYRIQSTPNPESPCLIAPTSTTN